MAESRQETRFPPSMPPIQHKQVGKKNPTEKLRMVTPGAHLILHRRGGGNRCLCKSMAPCPLAGQDNERPASPHTPAPHTHTHSHVMRQGAER